MFGMPRGFRVFVFAAALLRVDAFSQDKKITYGAESDLNSSYVWRGMVLDKRRPVLENSVWLDGYGVNLTFWGQRCSAFRR